MWIGIDMLGVQSLGAPGRPSGRFGRQLVAALLARDPSHRYVLYAHEGLPVGAIPAGRNAVRSPLPPVAGQGCPRRAAVQRLLDFNPDGLDWLVLLDPFDASFGGVPPEAPLQGPKVASVVLDLDQAPGDDRRLAPIRRHDAILAATEAVAADWRRRLGLGSRRVATIGLGVADPFAAPGSAEPLSRVSAEELGRLGIVGPFLLAAGADRAALMPILDAYRLLPVDRRSRHQLVIAGPVHDPAGVRSYLRDHGAEDGLILAGELPEATRANLLGRASAYLGGPDGPGLALAEALSCGVPVIAGHSPIADEVVGEAGLIVPARDSAAFARSIDDLLSDPDLAAGLRERALARSSRFAFGPVADAVLATLDGSRLPAPGSARFRVNRGHPVRPRIAVYPAVSGDGPGRLDLAAEVPDGWRDAFGVDLYLEPGDSGRTDGLPTEFGGFDSRLFARNDALLGYHAVVYRVASTGALGATLDRARRRPGLVVLSDGDWLDRVGDAADVGQDAPSDWLREVFATGSRVLIHSPRHLDRIAAALPEFAGRVALVPPSTPDSRSIEETRARSRDRLDLVPGALVIGQFGRREGLGGSLLSPRAFQAIARLVPELVLLSFDAGRESAQARREAEALGIADRFVEVGPVTSADAREVIAVLDLAIHPGETDSPSILDLLKAGIATIALDRSYPDAVVRNVRPSPRGGELARAVRELASDASARTALGRSARAYAVGTPDAELAASVLLGEIARCAAEVPRGAGRPARGSGGPRPLSLNPQIARPATTADGPASLSR